MVQSVQPVDNREEEIDIHFQAGFHVGLIQAATLLEQHDTESVEPAVA